jgi:hypothetical protein
VTRHGLSQLGTIATSGYTKHLFNIIAQVNMMLTRESGVPKKELECWVRATRYKTAASNTIIYYPTVMVYSICLLDQSDFESVGREMPKGTGVDSSITDGTKAAK